MGMAANPSGAHQAGRVFAGRIDGMGVSVRHRRTLTPAASRPRLANFNILQLASSACKTSRIHKPSAVVSFGLPDPLSFLVRGRAMVAADRGQTSTGKASGSGCKSGLTAISRESNVCKDTVTKAETQEIKDKFAVGLCGIDASGGQAKPDQYGRSICRLGHGSARASGRQAFLTAPRLVHLRS